MNFTIKFDEKAFANRAVKVIQRKAEPTAYKMAYNRFYAAKQALLKQFDRHPVTVEISAGANAPTTTPNISDTLDGYGNLFSFIGFEQGENPIPHLRSVLEQGISFRKKGFKNGYWTFGITMPSREEIEEATPMPWEQGNSWAAAVEEGMSNLSYYLNKKAGRSGGGIMVKGLQWEVNDDLQFQPVKYLSEILTNFRDRMKNT